LSWPMIALMGVQGAVVCLILAAIIVNVMLWAVYERQIATALDEGEVEQALKPQHAGAGQILTAVTELLKRHEIPCCLLHGYHDYPERINGDVDCLVPAESLPRLAEILHKHRAEIGADVVQWLDDASPLIVLCGKAEDGRLNWLQLHASTRFAMSNLVFYDDEQVLKSATNHNGFAVPAPRVEFACVAINRIIKRKLNRSHAAALVELYEQDPEGCRAEIRRFWGERDTQTIIACVQQSDFDALDDQLGRLRATLLVRQFVRQPLGAIGSWMAGSLRRLRRFLRPSYGLHVVFLGPDGVGKSTIIEHVSSDIEPAFMRQSYQTFAALLPMRLQPRKKLPHELPPRSYPASLVKAAWWTFAYTIGYVYSVHLTRGRAGIALCHRYLLDVIVDRKRYRYSGPQWLLHAIWRVAIKPDLIILLDAPPEVIQTRKREVAFEETARQRSEYRALVEHLPNARIIDASQNPQQTAADANAAIVELLKRRVQRRFDLSEAPSC
jgi:thymidylate kinase